MTVDERLQKLEKHAHVWKCIAIGCMLFIGTAVFAAAAVDSIRQGLITEKVTIIAKGRDNVIGQLDENGIKYKGALLLDNGDKGEFVPADVGLRKDAIGSIMLLGGKWGNASGFWDNTNGTMICCNKGSLRLVTADNSKNIAEFTADGDLILGYKDHDPKGTVHGISLKQLAAKVAKIHAP